MIFELATGLDTAPLEILDTQVLWRSAPVWPAPRHPDKTHIGAPRSWLSVQFLCRKAANRPIERLNLPALSWFDAGQLQRFTQDLATARHPATCQTDLPDAGLRLTGSVSRIAGRWTTGRTIAVEPIPGHERVFPAFTIHGSHHDFKTYAQKLYTRLWETFCRG
jgi:hypothetical protein